ncbi:hypothetical protein Avbf_19194 [Armadillidium vulgare]|nr:hypothetical protein Avbf_19194 [Armadillidium vulgare]
MARAITLGLSSAYGYVELSDEEMFLERTVPPQNDDVIPFKKRMSLLARPITPTHSMVYFQPLPDVVSNYWRPNPAFQDMPGIPSSPSGESRDRVSKLVDKISSCFARRKSESTSLVTADHSDDASNEHNNRVLHDRLVGEELDRQELQVQEERSLIGGSNLLSSRLPEVTLCFVFSFFISAMAIRYCTR